MSKFYTVLALLFISLSPASAQVKILFDCTKAQTAGNADWVIDADVHDIYWHPAPYVGQGTGSDPQRYPTPAQSTVTSSTVETYWEGSLSSWGIDCVNYGYEVEELPVTGSITYGDNSNAQDLSNYKVYVMDEPNIKFTSAEKTAILQFVQHGGGLFMISDHNNSDRNNDGWDSPNIWNDFAGTVTPKNPFGIRFDLLDFSASSSNVVTSSTDSITHGPYGTVTALQFNGATTMTIEPDSNSTVTADIFTNGSSLTGRTNVMFAHAHYGAGKVAAISDSSPFDDGTGNPNTTLYSSYATAVSGNHRKLIMNATIWLAEGGQTVNGVNDLPAASSFNIFKTNSTTLRVINDNEANQVLTIYDILGKQVIIKELTGATDYVDIAKLSEGIYIARMGDTSHKFVK